MDVFASADLETMDRAEQQNLIQSGTRGNFVSNRLVLVVPSTSTSQVGALADLSQTRFQRIAIGTPESVPAGRYAKQALTDPTQAEVPILTIALDSGFQSLGPFNRAFKADTGMTPTEFRRASQA